MYKRVNCPFIFVGRTLVDRHDGRTGSDLVAVWHVGSCQLPTMNRQPGEIGTCEL